MKKYIKPTVEVYVFETSEIFLTTSTAHNEVGGGDWNAKEHDFQTPSSNTFSLWGDDEE